MDFRREQKTEKLNVSQIFGESVFGDAQMKERLPREAYAALQKTISDGSDLSQETADVIANCMKNWAVERGATHYTHWFQPLTGVTAEKHDSFISAPGPDGRSLMEFSGRELVRGEPDASSFPSGGLRATFEARGYTTWDCTSPAFLKEDASGVVLCIPTAFCSYRGEALDKKTPLLRSIQAVNRQALRLLRALGNTTSQRVIPSAGIEQEYFLIDKKKFLQREDLIYTGRTLFGARPPKGQEMDDHYLGSIPEKIGAFMRDVNLELWKLGVPAKTQHNEAAPAQHEMAPIYQPVNLAVDQNQMIMETLRRVANRHRMACLLHEKPFEGLNGSGKHNNWSLSTDDGINLLEPGVTPHDNIQFLLILTCILKAVNDHSNLLGASAACVGNDSRLGQQEAPPSVVSVFVGEQLQDVLKQLIDTGEATRSLDGGRLLTGVLSLPSLAKDATDRNRTSPFAFTGNKFEFRMVGASDSAACPNTVINTIAAEAFCEAADRLEQAADVQQECHDIIREYAALTQRIVFNGNNYTEEWIREAERRGLPKTGPLVDAEQALISDEAIAMFERFRVFSGEELRARCEVNYEKYVKAVHIEARTMIDMAGKQIIPAVVSYIREVASSMSFVQQTGIGADTGVQQEILFETSDLLAAMQEAVHALEDADEAAMKAGGIEAQARACRNQIVPAMQALREPADRLEMIVGKEYWPFPGYGELVFEV